MSAQRRLFTARRGAVYDGRTMARLLRRRALAVVVALATSAVLLVGCKGKGDRAAADASADAGDAGVGIDVNLPETVIVYVDASAESVGTSVNSAAPAASPLPRPCTDKALGTVTFTDGAEKVSITSSKSGVHATCVRLDEHKLLCDWFDGAGNPTITRRGVTFGPKTKIGGNYDATHTFGCPAQDDTPPPRPKAPAPKPPTGRKAPKR